MKFHRRLVLMLLAIFASGTIALAAPTKKELQAKFEQRYPEIRKYKADGKVGETSAGFLEAVKDADATLTKPAGTVIEELSWYETQVNRICVDGYTMGVCLYDRRLFSEPDLRRVTRSHPATITRFTLPAFFSAIASRISRKLSSFDASRNPHVLMTIASASAWSAVIDSPSIASRPSIRSESTRFFGHPRLTNATD
jgi:uncharacterized protein YdbL (DUF1318 family)